MTSDATVQPPAHLQLWESWRWSWGLLHRHHARAVPQRMKTGRAQALGAESEQAKAGDDLFTNMLPISVAALVF